MIGITDRGTVPGDPGIALGTVTGIAPGTVTDLTITGVTTPHGIHLIGTTHGGIRPTGITPDGTLTLVSVVLAL